MFGGHDKQDRRLSRRGRLTLLALGTLAAFLAGYLSGKMLPVLTTAPRFESRPPDVSGGVSAAADVGELGSLLERLPVSTEDYASRLQVDVGGDPAAPPRFIESLNPPASLAGVTAPLRIEYSFDVELTRQVLAALSRARVSLGHAIVLDPRTGRVLAWVSTDALELPAQRAYPAASLIKVVTAAAALDNAPDKAREPCVYRGNPYRMSRSRIDPPRSGNQASLERALATSNNQCFAQLAVHAVGGEALLDALSRFGWLERPAAGHPAGRVDPGDDAYSLGLLGCGLSGCRITPLHAAQLAVSLARGERVEPWWIDRILDGRGSAIALPPHAAPRRIMREDLARELRSMLVQTTTRGTARSAFRTRRGRPRLGEIRVAGKTGNLSGDDPDGRYEWFVGLAPADEPTIAIAVLQVQTQLWWARSSQIAADVLESIFCERGHCSPERAARYTGDLGSAITPILLSDSVAGDAAAARSTRRLH